MNKHHVSMYFQHPNYYNIPCDDNDDGRSIIIIQQPPTLANLALRAAFNSRSYTYADWWECHLDETLVNAYLMDNQKYFLEFRSVCCILQEQFDLHKQYTLRDILTLSGTSQTFNNRQIRVDPIYPITLIEIEN